MRSLPFLLLSFLLLSLSLPVKAAAVWLDQNFHSLTPRMEYVQDAAGEREWQDFSQWGWQPVASSPPQFGYTQSAYWFRFDLRGDPEAVSHAWIEISYPILDEIDVYLIGENGALLDSVKTGDIFPFSTRVLAHENFLIPLEKVLDGAATVVIRVRTESSMEVPVSVLENITLIERSQANSWIHGAFFGAIIMLGFYHILIFLAAGDRGFLYFAGLTTVMGLIQATLWGSSYHYLWPGLPAWNEYSISVLINMSNFFGIMYVSTVVQIRERSIFLARLFNAMAIVSLGLIALSFILPYQEMIRITLIAALVTLVMGAFIVLLRMYDRYLPAYAVFAASVMYTLGSVAYILGKLEVIPNSLLLDNALVIGQLVQAVLFGFALSLRITVERNLREEAQRESAVAQDLLLETERAQNQRLDREVRSRTRQLEEANVRLQQMSATDALTGLYNRRQFDETLDRQFELARRQGTELSVLVIDLDHFKSLNDTYGHAVGDDVLKQTAARLQTVLKRPSDRAFRYGGEEFVVLLPDSGTTAARIVAKQIWSAIRGEAMMAGNQSLRVTVSIGIATEKPGADSEVATLFQRADAQLYRAKEQGRDRICVD
ncbi:diguanylate cyclase [uncultured Thalassolituus sp.]|uniref:sensor domain-containing diguanylate cyclase n=1 Tax=uncultured Thalassolituus sp. TaxID=285273 RepID=UPI0026261E9E|nr:diguanylate cyclase [uncultured Thalassolituus sp.]